MSGIYVQTERGFLQKLALLNWGMVFVLCCVMGVGATALYSAAGGSFSPWAEKQIVRFFMGCIVMICIAMVDIRWWYRLTWPAGAGAVTANSSQVKSEGDTAA